MPRAFWRGTLLTRTHTHTHTHPPFTAPSSRLERVLVSRPPPRVLRLLARLVSHSFARLLVCSLACLSIPRLARRCACLRARVLPRILVAHNGLLACLLDIPIYRHAASLFRCTLGRLSARCVLALLLTHRSLARGSLGSLIVCAQALACFPAFCFGTRLLAVAVFPSPAKSTHQVPACQVSQRANN